MVERELRVPVAGGDAPVFTVRPDGPGPYPVALLFMDGIGFREQIRENARRFAAGGFFVAAPDLYHRSGEGVTFDMGRLAASGFQGPEAETLHAAMALVTPEAVAGDVRAIVDVLPRIQPRPAARGSASATAWARASCSAWRPRSATRSRQPQGSTRARS